MLALVWPTMVALALALALAAAVLGLVRDGTYATAGASAAASSALLGLAALERTPLAGVLRVAFLLALLALPLG